MSVKSENTKLLINFFNKYGIKGRERRELTKLIKPIYSHIEFQKRFSNNFLHHGDISISEHIIEDAIKTYLLSKIYVLKKNDKLYDTRVAVIIAMLHDLYTVPWQNNKLSKVKKFRNKHGFRHPVEAVINSYCWYPELFQDKDRAIKIIDGIIHHMYPLPVIVMDDSSYNKWELKNYLLYLTIPNYIKDMLIDSTNRGKIGNLSLARSKYMEGVVMSKADKYVSIRQLKNIYDMLSLITGRNKRLKKDNS